VAFLKFGRDAELEADRLGVANAAKTGWTPEAMPGVLGTLGRLDEAQGSRRGVPNWALTHPPAADRIAKVHDAVAAASTAGGTATNAPALEAVIDKIVFGDSREKGMVRGSDLLHPVLRFALRFPSGWDISNGAEQVTAVEKEGNIAVMLQFSPNSQSTVEQAAHADMKEAGVTETSGANTRVNGLEAYVGTYEKTVGTVRAIVRAAHVRAGRQIYIVAGLASADDFARVERDFNATIQSFRELSQQEADRIQPSRIAFATVRNGDTWDAIAARSGTPVPVKGSTLAIMNGSDPVTPPKAGARIRVITGGS